MHAIKADRVDSIHGLVNQNTSKTVLAACLASCSEKRSGTKRA